MVDIIFGVVSGIVAALGMGGGTVLILLINLFENIEQHVVQGTNLVFFIPTSIASIYMNIKHKKIDYKISKVLIFSGIVGSICGSLISFCVDNKSLKKYFGFFLIFIAIFEICSYFKEKN